MMNDLYLVSVVTEGDENLGHHADVTRAGSTEEAESKIIEEAEADGGKAIHVITKKLQVVWV